MNMEYLYLLNHFNFKIIKNRYITSYGFILFPPFIIITTNLNTRTNARSNFCEQM